MDITKLNREILEAVRQQLGCEEDDESKDTEIGAMDALTVFDRYLTWNGIIGYSADFWDAVENIKEAAGRSEG